MITFVKALVALSLAGGLVFITPGITERQSETSHVVGKIEIATLSGSIGD